MSLEVTSKAHNFLALTSKDIILVGSSCHKSQWFLATPDDLSTAGPDVIDEVVQLIHLFRFDIMERYGVVAAAIHALE